MPLPPKRTLKPIQSQLPSAPKKRPARKLPPKGETPLDLTRKKIAEEEAKIQAQMASKQQLIEDAPKIAKEQERLRREQFVSRAARTEHRIGSRAALPDRRYELNAGVPGKQRRLRAERNRGRTTFFLLLFVFIGVILWLFLSMQGSA